MKYIYCIVPVNYEYNDEVNYAEGHGEPELAFSTEEGAEKKRTELEIEAIRGLELYSYGYESSEVTTSPRKLCELIGAEPDDFGTWIVPSVLTPKQGKEILSHLRINFYEVTKVKVED